MHFLHRFKHSTPAQLGKNGTGPAYRGTLGTYGPGGFVRLLKPAEFKTVHYNVDELYRNKWIDFGTRAIFLELTVWNPRLYILCSIKYVSVTGVFRGWAWCGGIAPRVFSRQQEVVPPRVDFHVLFCFYYMLISKRYRQSVTRYRAQRKILGLSLIHI